MTIAVFVFWCSTLAILYAYAGYPLALALLARVRRRPLTVRPQADGDLPGVTIIVPVHNERSIIGEKLANTVALDYPAGKLEALFVSDGSTDGTAEAIAAAAGERIRLLVLAERSGKAAGLNAGLAAASHDLIVFSDASIMLERQAIRAIALPFQHADIGCVSGEDFIPGGGGEGLYGRYEMSLRGQESALGSIVGASGSFYAQRRHLCDQFIPNAAPDFLSVLLTVARGYRAVTCPDARGQMSALNSVKDEFRRKVRTILRGITTLMDNARMMNPLTHGLFAFELLSHKLARWLVPIFLLGMLLSSAWLAAGSLFYALLLAGQLAFYLMAGLGVWAPHTAGGWLPVRVAVYFTTVNLATLSAWIKFVVGVRQEIWSPTRREAA